MDVCWLSWAESQPRIDLDLVSLLWLRSASIGGVGRVKEWWKKGGLGQGQAGDGIPMGGLAQGVGWGYPPTHRPDPNPRP